MHALFQITLLAMLVFWIGTILYYVIRGKSWFEVFVLGCLVVTFTYLAISVARRLFSIGDAVSALIIIIVHTFLFIAWPRLAMKLMPGGIQEPGLISLLPMRPSEQANGLFPRRYNLTVTTDVKDAETLERNFADYKVALLSWLELRRARARTILFVVMSKAELHEMLLNVIERLPKQDEGYARIFERTKPDFALLDEQGFLRTKYRFRSTAESMELLCSCGPRQFFGPFTPKIVKAKV